MKRLAAGLLAALALCGCEQPHSEAPPQSARPEPVVVYASYENETYLPSLFAAFTRETGLPVTVRHRPEQQIVSEVIENRGSPPADVLLTRSVQGAWRAADEGALRPLQSDTIPEAVPDWLRDPDDSWTATGIRSIEVVCNAERRSDCDSLENYQDLGKPEFRGRLCLSVSALAVNRTLIAGLIADHGVRPAELIVRDWIANLALPAFETEAALLAAVEAGTCGLGVVSGPALNEFGSLADAATWPQPGYADVDAAGIGRHARSPVAARRLVEWLVDRDAQAAQSAAIGLRPVNPRVSRDESGYVKPEGRRNVGVFGLYATDAVMLAERARWR